MSDQQLTGEFGVRVMGRTLAPGRYLRSGRSWISRSRFRPLVDLRDAIRLLDSVTDDYSLLAKPGSVFTAKMRVAGRIEKAAGEPKARTVSLALARAIGLDVPDVDAAVPAATTGRARNRTRGA